MTTAPEPGGPDDRRAETPPPPAEPTTGAEPATDTEPATDVGSTADATAPTAATESNTGAEPTAAADPTVTAVGPTASAADPTTPDAAPGPTEPGPTTPGPTGPDPDTGGFGAGGFRPPPPPPGTSGYATRFGLVRPTGDRYIAGVCGAFARATNTDPVLWRVALPVLTVLGGFGILLYLLGWLLIPAEGDSASPLESLLGRGWSSTSRVLTIVLTVTAGGWLIGAVIGGITGKLVVFAAIIAVVVLVANSRGNAPWQNRPPGSVWGPASGWGTPTGSGQPGPGQPGPQPWWSAGTGTYVATPHTDTVTDTPDWVPGATGTGTGWPDATTAATAAAAAPAAPGTTAGADPTAAYRPPFAPGGPFATSRLDYGDSPTYPENFPGLQPPPAPPARAPRRRSPATRVTLSLTLIVVGILAVLDRSQVASISAPEYFAAALATMGVGLMVGSLFGRSRAPIWLGILLLLGLMSSAAVREYRGHQLFRPTTLAQLSPAYRGTAENLTLDLSHLSFVGQDRVVHVSLDAGLIRVLLPPNVDATVNASVGAGEAQLFGQGHGGTGVHAMAINNGKDGPGGGKITIDANIRFVGQVEVVR